MRHAFTLLISLCLTLAFALGQSGRANAQDAYFVRFQAEPSADEAITEARRYAQTLSDVTVYELTGGWYALALGPYSQPFAELTAQSLALSGAIPQDSFIASTSDLGAQIWPTATQNATQSTGQNAAQSTAQSTAISPAARQGITLRTVTTQQPTSAAPSQAEIFRPSAEQRKEIQRVLAWQGLYTGAIDGIFGPASSRAIRQWQIDNGLRPTGDLTQDEYAQLVNSFNALFDAVGMTRITDTQAGLAIDLPMGLVTRTGEEAPFAIYEQDNGLAKVLLISMTGDQQDLSALYDTMQSFDIMPREGSRYLRSNSFVITGNKGDTAVYTEARHEGDTIKGFALIWPRDDEERRTLLIDRMRASVQWLAGTLSSSASIAFDADAFSKFAQRRARHIWSGVYINETGHILTSLAPADTCRDMTAEQDWAVSERARSAELGLRILKPIDPEFTTLRTAPISAAPLAIGQEAHLFGYSFGRQALAPAYSVGKVSAGTPTDQIERGRQQLKLLTLAGDLGAPLLDDRGALRGIVTPTLAPRALPEGFSMASTAPEILEWLERENISVTRAASSDDPLTETLRTQGYEMVALLHCWD